MKFYVDFEATQFSERIISVGCVNERGETFKSLVSLTKGDKLTNFITNLTGITKTMLEDAPCADDVFFDMYEFVERSCGDTFPEYYCYGDSDIRFLKQTMKKMTNTLAITFVASMIALMEDYSKVVKNYFNSSAPIGLFRVYSFIQPEMEKQSHDPLEDALMLQYIERNLRDKCKPEDRENLPSSNRSKLPKHKPGINPTINPVFYTWDGQRRHTSTTNGTKENWHVKVTFNRKATQHTKYFADLETAILWCIKFGDNNFSPLKEEHYKWSEEAIFHSSETKTRMYGCYWEVKNA
jgi:inhibitor of KinA sporulation pathway (predicted exonuclease)